MRKVLYIFGILTDADVEWMARTGIRRRLADGDVVIEQGKPVDAVIFLLQGEFLVSAEGIGQVARLGAGEIVGEMSLVDSVEPSATVTARGECLALFLDKAALVRKLETDAAFGCRFYRALAIFLADRLRAMGRRLSFSDAEHRSVMAPGPSDELDPAILDTVSTAGERFDRMLRTLIGR